MIKHLRNRLKFLTIFLAMAIYVLSPYICFAENSFNSNSGPGWFCSVKTASGKAETMERFPPYSTNSQLPTTNYPPSKTITYFYDGDEIENEEDATGDMSTYLTRSVRGVVDTSGNMNVNYLLSNAKDVIGQTDSTGNNITTTYNYDAYGKSVDFANPSSPDSSQLTSLSFSPNHEPPTTNPQHPTTNYQLISSFSISDNPFQYSGYYCDKESGLYYLKARYYSPELMTFISMDTYDLANKYAYGNNDPIDGIDPNGHSFLKYLLTGICALALINPEIWPALSAMAPQELVQLYTPETVAKALNIAIAAAYTTAAILTLGVTAYQAGWAITTSVVNAGIGAALAAGDLTNACIDYNQAAQLAVGYALMFAGLALMGYGYRSAKLPNGGRIDVAGADPEENIDNGNIIQQKKIDDVEKFQQDLQEVMNKVQSEIIYTTSGINKNFQEYISAERLGTYIKSDNGLHLAGEQNYINLRENGVSRIDALVKSKWGNCSQQAFYALTLMQKKGYSDINIHGRILLDIRYPHYFATIKFKGVTYLVDPWAGKSGPMSIFKDYLCMIKSSSQEIYANKYRKELGIPTKEFNQLENSLLE